MSRQLNVCVYLSLALFIPNLLPQLYMSYFTCTICLRKCKYIYTQARRSLTFIHNKKNIYLPYDKYLNIQLLHGRKHKHCIVVTYICVRFT